MRNLAVRVAWGLGALWALPVTLVGVALGALGLAFGARAALSDGALVFHRFPWGPGGALTLGNAVLHTGESLDELTGTYASDAGAETERVRLGDHERAHVYQYLVLGPLFLPLYLLSGGIHADNRFERAADRYALTGRGWWPWPDA